MSATLKIRIPKADYDMIAAFMFISYFCSEALRSAVARFIGSGVFDVIYNILFVCGVFLLAVSRKRRRPVTPIIWYAVIALMFIFTILIHPEYKDWYFESTYGIQVQFFRAVGGIWAFLVVYQVPNKEKLLKYLRITAWIMFIFLCLKFASAQVRGYWVSYGADYSKLEREYNLGFGYNMLFPTIFFAAEAFLNRKKKYYIPFAIGALLILFGGSRGATIWVAAVFLFMLPYRWKAMSKTEKSITILLILIIAPLIWLIYLYYDEIIQVLTLYLSSKGITSRTIMALLSGEFAEANGRDEIYQIAIERIREGGLFGNGVFGERVAVGQRYRWGYAHNIFLELYAAFGYLGGTIVSLTLIISIIRTAVSCRERTEQIIFMTFLGASMKLLLSDSFWFNSSFWGLLAIIVMWNKRYRLPAVYPGTVLSKY